MSRGERPRLAALAGLTSSLLSAAAMAAVAPRLAASITQPVNSLLTSLMIFSVAVSSVLFPLGLTVLVRGLLDLAARRSTMAGLVVGMRRDAGLFGRNYRIAVQAGDRGGMSKGLWAESFRVTRATFDRLSPGDRVTIEYSPRLRYVYSAAGAERVRAAG
jgi:hypothetical protein